MLFILASSDGRIRIWEDISEKKREEEERNRAEKAYSEQVLTNLMQQNHYAEALAFSLTLARPYRCSKFIIRLDMRFKLNEQEHYAVFYFTGVQRMMELKSNELHSAVKKMHSEELVVLLHFAAQWNTNSRTADVGQLVLYCVLHSFPPKELLKMPNFASVIEAYVPYTTRHFDRLTRARQNATFLDYTLAQMSLSNL
ncbi:unnamed protein product [Brugia timori]|uniref:Utp13 domain-containing protein n=1 Tax=Brugia timori TaxID=42155 RepID=A0A0R3Q334_9BILA|nr:unnamed protein product [Brugia timori]